ncbi:hypothetical protein [Falsihalocynthiibacter arcticus]|uniref:Uncharacterized protein n=1 Tax=Falsihalocynthiibacter arcticus TaxID=1579316 RepID=A0A126V072_9RHOB|nr:hypothetical protein [Falsihalocynthiibacter arcticus]AML51690.1 hypothetical protein RC74_10830 [Falsihalocynthiibacter arcticus]
MGKRYSDHDIGDNGPSDEYWETVFGEIGEILYSHFLTELADADLVEEAEKFWSKIFLFAHKPHAGARDLKALERLAELLHEIETLEISEFVRDRLSIWSSSYTDFSKRERPLGWSATQTATPYDAYYCLFDMHKLLSKPIENTRSYIISEHDPRSKTNATNWKSVDAIRGCLSYWNETKAVDRRFGHPKLETKFGQFVNDIWSYFEIEGSPHSAMNALKRFEGNTKA